MDISHLSLTELINLNTKVRGELKKSHRWFHTERPDWDAYFSHIAYAVSLRGSCCRRRAGAVFVSKDHDILSTGYNGKAATLENCLDCPCAGATSGSGTGLESCEAIHAELNALMRCHDRRLIHTLYVTCSPCTNCVDMLLGTSCERVVFPEAYAHNTESQRRWLAAGRAWVHYKNQPET